MLKFMGIAKAVIRGKCEALDSSKEQCLKQLVKLSLQEAGKGRINQRQMQIDEVRYRQKILIRVKAETNDVE